MFYGGGGSGIRQLTDGSYVLTGFKVNYPVSTDYEMEINKLSPQGELLWKRHYGGPRSDYGYDIIMANNRQDGLDGFVISGRSEHSENGGGAHLLLVKTNCMGLLTHPQAAFTTDTTVYTTEQLISFTNTSQYIYPDSIDGGHYLWHFGDGSTSNEQHPNYQYPKSGSYEVQLTAIVCSDTSIYTQKIVVETEVGINTRPISTTTMWVGLPQPHPANKQSVIPYQLSPGVQQAALQFYNIKGQLVQSIPLNTRPSAGQTSLSHQNFEAGIYFYSLVADGAVAQRRKMVVGW